jgi:hypothetical protein
MKRLLLIQIALVLATPAFAQQPLPRGLSPFAESAEQKGTVPLPPPLLRGLSPFAQSAEQKGTVPLPPQEGQKQLQAPQLQPPQQNVQPQAAQQPNNGAQPNKAGKPPEFFKARREALAARKQARIDRMRQFKAERAAAEEQLYQEWHERYLADAPVRAAYYNNLSNNLLAEAALVRERTAAYYYLSSPVFVPVVPVYPYYYSYPGYSAPIYGQIIWTW